MTQTKWVPVAGVVILWATGAVAQGLYWEARTTGIGDAARTSQFYAMPKMMKIVRPGAQTVLIRVDQDKFVIIDPKKRVYREMSGNEMESLGRSMQSKMEAAKAQMQQQLAKLPPEQRAAVEKAMGSVAAAPAAAPAAVELKSTGETKTIAGYACTKYVATADGKPVLTAWTTRDVPGFAALRTDWLAFQKRLGSMQGGGGGAIGQAYAHIEGFPMETEMSGITTEVTRVEQRTIPASDFDVPADFKKEAMPALPTKP